MGPLPWVAVLMMVLIVLGVSSSILYYGVGLKSLGSDAGGSSGGAKWVW